MPSGAASRVAVPGPPPIVAVIVPDATEMTDTEPVSPFPTHTCEPSGVAAIDIGSLPTLIVPVTLPVAADSRVGLVEHRLAVRQRDGLRVGEPPDVRQRAEVVVERAVLLHQDHHVLDVAQAPGLARESGARARTTARSGRKVRIVRSIHW